MKRNATQPGLEKQRGFLLLGVLFMLLLILIALAIAAPKMAESIRRDKEVETVHRGQQYARAIQVFYAATGNYPNSMDQLMKTNNQRFLRKRYLDPMTGKDDWRIIHLGEAKVPPMGLFGQTVQGAGLTSGITNGSNGTGATPGTGVGGSSSGFGASGSSFGSSGSAFGGSGSGSNSTGSAFGSSASTSPFGGTSGSAFGSSGSSASPTGGTDTGSSSSGFGSSSTSPGSSSGFGSSPGIGGATSTGANGTTGGNGTGTTGSSTAFGSPGATFGGAPIVGVGLLSKKTSILIYRKQTHYNQWEFVFDPTQNVAAGAVGGGNISGAMTGTNGASGAGSPGFGSGNGTGSGFGSSTGSGFGSSTGSGFGSSGGSGFGGSPSSPVSPTSPPSNTPQ